MDFTSFTELLRESFKDFNIPQVIQPAVVGGTLCTLAWLAYQFLIRPVGSIGWYRARTRELLRARHDIADAVTQAEATLTVLREQLLVLQAPPAPALLRPAPSFRPASIASQPSLPEEEDPSERHVWRREHG